MKIQYTLEISTWLEVNYDVRGKQLGKEVDNILKKAKKQLIDLTKDYKVSNIIFSSLTATDYEESHEVEGDFTFEGECEVDLELISNNVDVEKIIDISQKDFFDKYSEMSSINNVDWKVIG